MNLIDNKELIALLLTCFSKPAVDQLMSIFLEDALHSQNDVINLIRTFTEDWIKNICSDFNY